MLNRYIGIAITFLISSLSFCAWGQFAPTLTGDGRLDGATYLRWDLFPGAANYTVYWSTQSPVTTADAAINISGGSTLRHIHTGLTAGTVYYYSVVAFDGGGNPTPLSNEVAVLAHDQAVSPVVGGFGDGFSRASACQFTLNGQNMSPQTVPLTAYPSQNQILLGWPLQASLGTYRLERKIPSIPDWTLVLSGTQQSFQENAPPLNTDSLYQYRLIATLINGCVLNPSDTVFVVPVKEPAPYVGGSGDGHSADRLCNSFLSGGTQDLPAQPIVIYPSQNQVLLSWEAVPGATSYTLERADVGMGNWTELLPTPNATTFSRLEAVPTINSGQGYDYRVRPNVPVSACPMTFSPPVSTVPRPEPSSFGGGASDGHATAKACQVLLDGTNQFALSQSLTPYPSMNTLKVAWAQETNAVIYVLERSDAAQNTWLEIQRGSTLFATESLPAINPGQAYDYRVSVQLADYCWMQPSPILTITARPEPASFGGGAGDGFSGFKVCNLNLNGTPQVPPSNPISVYSSQRLVTISWPFEPGTINYTIERSDFQQNNWSQVHLTSDGNTVLWTQTAPSISENVVYEYRVRPNLPGSFCPVDFSLPMAGVAISEPSAYPGGAGDGFGSYKACQVELNGNSLAPASQPLASYPSIEQILIAWPAEVNVAQYVLERSLAAQNSWTVVHSSPTVRFASESVPAISVNTPYDYRVRVQLNDQCWMNPSPLAPAIARGAPVAYTGGDGDGHGWSRACDMELDGTPGGIPSQPILLYASQNQILVSWPQEANTSGYTVQRKLSASSSWATLGTTNASTLFYSDSDPLLSGGQSYDYRVSANLLAGCPLAPSPASSAVVFAEPLSFGGGSGDGFAGVRLCNMLLNGAPQLATGNPITVYSSQRQLLVAWPIEPGALTYTVERSDFQQNNWTQVFQTPNASTISFLQAASAIVEDQFYEYRVRPNMPGTACPMTFSSGVAGVAKSEPAAYQGGAGDGFSSFKACQIDLNGASIAPSSQQLTVYPSMDRLLMAWPAETNAALYILERSLASQNNWTEVHNSASIRFAAETLPAISSNTQYEYRVRVQLSDQCWLNPSPLALAVARAEPAAFGGGDGDGYGQFRACDMQLDGTPGGIPSQPIFLYASQRQMLISWPQEANTSGYSVQRKLNSASSWITLTTANSSTFSYVDSDPALIGGQLYDYRVSAILQAGCPLAPSPVNSSVVFAEPAAYPGGAGDGYAGIRLCNTLLSGVPQIAIGNPITVYSSQRQILVAWPLEPGALTYTVERSDFQQNNWAQVFQTPNASTLSFTQTAPAITENQFYEYRVRPNMPATACPMTFSAELAGVAKSEPAAYAGGAGDGYATYKACELGLNGALLAALSQPISTYPSMNSLLLAWPTETNGALYVLERSLGGQNNWTVVQSGTGLFAAQTQPAIVSGTTYDYRVTVQLADQCWMNPSPIASVVSRPEPAAFGGGAGDGYSGFRLCNTLLNGTPQLATANPIAVYSSQRQILVAWPLEPGALTYTVERSDFQQNTWSQVYQTPDGITLSWSQTAPAINEDQLYDYRVRPNLPPAACQVNFSTPVSGVASSEPAAYPGGAGDGYASYKACQVELNGVNMAPASQPLVSYPSMEYLLLAWPTETNASIYVLERSLSAQNSWSQVQSGPVRFGSESPSAITSNVAYDYRVRVQLADQCWMNPSPIATVIARAEPSAFGGGDGDGFGAFLACDMFLDGTPGGIPSQSIVVYPSQSQMLLSWPSENNASGYVVQRKLSAVSSWSTLATTNASTLFYLDNDQTLSPGQSYDYRVSANLLAGCPLGPSPVESEVLRAEPAAFGGGAGDGFSGFRLCNTTLSGGTQLAQGGLLTVYSSQHQILVAWPSEPGALTYTVERSDFQQNNWNQVLQTPNATTLFFTQSLPAVSANTLYEYRVRPNMPATSCPITFSPESTGVAKAEPSSYPGGQGDGYATFKSCDLGLNGALLAQASQSITPYPSQNNILLSWPSETNGALYVLERSLNGQNLWNEVQSGALTFGSESPTAITSGIPYDYRVRVRLADLCWLNPSPIATVVSRPEPAAFGGGDGDGYSGFRLCNTLLNGTGQLTVGAPITVYSSQNQVLVAWPFEPGAQTYTVERSAFQQNNWSQVYQSPDANTLSFIQTAPAVSLNQLYDYRVRPNMPATSCSITFSSLESGVAKAEPTAYPGGAGDGFASYKACQVELNGVNISPVAQTPTVYPSQESILLVWDNVPGFSTYRLERSDFQQNSWNQVYNGTTRFTQFNTPNPLAGVPYDYRLQVQLNDGCWLNPSALATGIVRPQPASYGGGDGDGFAARKACQVLLDGTNNSPLSSLPKVYASQGSLLISWTQESNAQGYELQRSDNGQNIWNSVFNHPTQLHYAETIPAIGPDTLYDYRVQVTLNDGCSLNPSPIAQGLAPREPAAYIGGAGDGFAKVSSCALLTLNHGTLMRFGSDTACTSDSTFLVAGLASAYQWYLDGVVLSGASSDTLYPTQSGLYSVVLTGAFACTASTDTVPLSITVNPSSPVGGTAYPNTLSCGPVALTAPQSSAGVTYYWQTVSGGQMTALPGDTVVVVNSPGFYYLNALDTMNCWSLGYDSVEVLSVTAPTELALTTESGTCAVPGLSGWNFFIGSDGRAIAAVQDTGVSLGFVTSYVYVTGQSSNQFDGTHEFLGRHWLISPQTQPSSPVILRLYFTQAELDSFIIASQASPTPNDDAQGIGDLVVIKYSGPTEDSTFDLSDATSVETLVPVSSGSDLNGNYIDIEVSGFSEFWISGDGGGGGPLPVSVVHQSGVCEPNGIRLSLETGAEVNNLGFVIQRSLDMASWDSLGWLPGLGTSSVGQRYEFMDSESLRNGSYYRWLQVDTDGSLESTSPLWIDCAEEGGPRIIWAGEGESGGVDVRLDWDIQERLDVVVLDMSGRQISEQVLEVSSGVSQFRVSKHRPSTGVYLVRVSGTRGDYVHRFVITGK